MELCSYEEFANNIKTFLAQRYNLLDREADEAMASFSLQELYDFDPEMVVHTAIDRWADDILYCWERTKLQLRQE